MFRLQRPCAASSTAPRRSVTTLAQASRPPADSNRRPRQQRSTPTSSTTHDPADPVDVEILPPHGAAEAALEQQQRELSRRGRGNATQRSFGGGSGRDELVVEVDDEDARLTELANRKAALLIKLVNSSGPEELEEAIVKHASEIDEALLLFLWKRIQAAEQHGEEAYVVDTLSRLFHRLRLEAERQASTPALRLLDDVLSTLCDDEAEPDPSERRAAARELLRRAFAGQAARGMDIFGMAAVLAAGDEVDPDQVVGEFVPQHQFLEEVQQLVEEARGALAKQRSELAAARGTLHEADIRAAVQQRAAAVAQAEDVLEMAEAL